MLKQVASILAVIVVVVAAQATVAEAGCTSCGIGYSPGYHAPMMSAPCGAPCGCEYFPALPHRAPYRPLWRIHALLPPYGAPCCGPVYGYGYNNLGAPSFVDQSGFSGSMWIDE